jgi:hypothetical protein
MAGSALEPARILLEEDLHPGSHWSFVLRRGLSLRITDREGGANVSALFYNADDRIERYNMADTLKAQHTARLTAGHVCYSDMGRVLVSITTDTCGWHDAVCGVSDAALVMEKYGPGRYQELRNDFHRNGRDSFLVELGKHGLGARDIVANVNFFSKVVADAEGVLSFVPGNSRPGDHVDLRAEMNVLMVLSSCPHPLDPDTHWRPRRVGLTVWKSDPPGPDDFCRTSCPENARGFVNTERLFLGL